MFKGLHSWLFTSYVLILIACLTLAAVVFTLAIRPLQARVIASQLTAQLMPTKAQVDYWLRQGLAPQQVMERIDEQPNDQGSYLLLLGPQGEVLAHSAGGPWAGQEMPEWVRFTDAPGDRFSPPYGQLTGPDGQWWVYVVAPPVFSYSEGEQEEVHVALMASQNRGGKELLDDLGRGLTVAGGLSLVLSLLLALIVSAAIARPLRRITQAAEAVASGNYDQELHIFAPDEVHRLAESFNTMTRQVKASQQTQRDFVANVSHELKTPLTSIQGFSQALLEGATQDEESRRRAAAIIHDEAGRMSRLVSELLELARLDAGQVVMARQPLDLAEVLRGCLEVLNLRAGENGVIWEMDLADLPPVTGDCDRLAQVFTNLLDNALAHTPAGGKVQITARAVVGSGPTRRWPDFGAKSPGWVEVGVADNGPGIPPEDLPRVFERFYQVDKSRARKKGGTGLGLAIVKEIVEAHGGAVKVESVLGLGSRFTVTLPVDADDRVRQTSERNG